mgnify:CR=1 FL=1
MRWIWIVLIVIFILLFLITKIFKKQDFVNDRLRGLGLEIEENSPSNTGIGGAIKRQGLNLINPYLNLVGINVKDTTNKEQVELQGYPRDIQGNVPSIYHQNMQGIHIQYPSDTDVQVYQTVYPRNDNNNVQGYQDNNNNNVQGYQDNNNNNVQGYQDNNNNNVQGYQDNNVQGYQDNNVQGYPSNGTSYPSNGTSYPSNGTSYPSNGTSYPSNGTSYPSNNKYEVSSEYSTFDSLARKIATERELPISNEKNYRKDGTSHGEIACRKAIETITGKRFRSIRPEFLKNPETGRNLELDCFNDELMLAIEYNGYQHYTWPNVFHKTYDDFIKGVRRDKFKMDVCDKNGIFLIVVPYTTPINEIPRFISNALPKRIKKVKEYKNC